MILKYISLIPGSKPGMIDYACWPYFERLAGKEGSILMVNFPTIRGYFEQMKEDDSVQAVHIPPDEITRFWRGLFTGNPQYDSA